MLIALLANLDFAGGVAVEPEPPQPASHGGGLGRISEKDIEDIERLLYQHGRARAVQRPQTAALLGTVVNPKPAVVTEHEPEPEPPAPPPPRMGALEAMAPGATCEIVGVVGFGPRDEAIGIAAALNDPLYNWIIKELGIW